MAFSANKMIVTLVLGGQSMANACVKFKPTVLKRCSPVRNAALAPSYESLDKARQCAFFAPERLTSSVS